MMKYILLLALSLSCRLVFGQFAVQLDKMNVVYTGIDNPMTIAANTCGKPILVYTNNGRITASDENHYLMYPAQTGTGIIYVCTKTDKKIDTIGCAYVRVKKFPDPIAMLMNKYQGTVSAAMAREAIGPVAYLEGFDFQAPYVITEMKVSVFRNNGVVIMETVRTPTGVRFCDDAKLCAVIKTLAPGDLLTIEGIKAIGPDNVIRRLNSIELKLN